jgi:hypothetical protein
MALAECVLTKDICSNAWRMGLKPRKNFVLGAALGGARVAASAPAAIWVKLGRGVGVGVVSGLPWKMRTNEGTLPKEGKAVT